MTSAPQATPQRVRAARLLQQLNDADALATEPAVAELAQLDPEAVAPGRPDDARAGRRRPERARPASA